MDDPDGVPFILPSLCCALFRKSAFEQIGHFDPDLEYSDDMDWYLRAREDGLGIELHKDVVLEHRRHDANLTKNSEKKERFHLLMLHKSIKRRREKGITSAPQFSDFLQQNPNPTS
jgi:GT2 family glycosyltransferase